MRAPRRHLLPLILVIVELAACTKTVRMVEPGDYDTALADTTRMFQINTHDGSQFVSKKASVEGDSVLVVIKGHQVQTDEWRQKKLAKVPIRIPVANIEQVSQIETKGAQEGALVLFLLVLLIIGLTTGGQWYGY